MSTSMDDNCDYLIDEELVDQCEQVRAIASKNWLNSASVSLAQLDQIRATVYNVGLSDANQLKPGSNLRDGSNRSQSNTELDADPPLSTVSLQKLTAWGSTNSIPELIKQHSEHKRPQSAKAAIRKTRPPSAKRTRPQSAKETQLPPPHPVNNISIAVLGAKYEPGSRPPKGAPVQHVTTGWVGPPAGLKFSDQFQGGNGFTPLVSPGPAATPEPPPAPTGTPDIPTGADEDQILDDYSIWSDSDVSECSNKEEQTKRKLKKQVKSPVLLRRPAPEPIHLSLDLPTAEDDDQEAYGDLDTDRLLSLAEEKLQKQTTDSFQYQHDPDFGRVNDALPSPVSDIDEDLIYISEESGTTVCPEAEPETLISRHIGDSPKGETVPPPPPHNTDKISVNFRDDKNVTVDITPRNIGRHVSELSPQKNRRTRSGRLDFSHVQSRVNSGMSVAKLNEQKSKLAFKFNSYEQPSGDSSYYLAEGQVRPVSVYEQSLMEERGNYTAINGHVEEPLEVTCSKPPIRPKSASNRPTTPVTTVTVDYGDEEYERKKKIKGRRRVAYEDVETMMQQVTLSDSEDVPVENVTDMGPRYKSEPVRNYYEISRHSQKPEMEHEEEKENVLYKTTKIIEFDEVEPKEIAFRSAIGALQIPKEKEDKEKDVHKGRQLQRPSSAKVFGKPPTKEPEKPGSRIGNNAMATKSASSVINTTAKPLRKISSRPNSAPSRVQKPADAHIKARDKGGKIRSPRQPDKSETKQEVTTAVEVHDERESVIDNLLKRAQALNHTESTTSMTTTEVSEDSAIRTATSSKSSILSSGTSLTAGSDRRVKSAAATSARHNMYDKSLNKHYATYSRAPRGSLPRRRTQSLGRRTVFIEPVFINTKRPESAIETKEEMECKQIQERLAGKGVNVTAETLERALYPPSGKTTYYEIEAHLPKSSSLSLLSHPREWLPAEYRRLRTAEKALDRVNEILLRQKLAEERRAKAAELGSAKKRKKKGKKGLLRRSNSTL